MANSSQRMWLVIPNPDGVVIAKFPVSQYNPRMYPQEQFGIAEYLEKMPASEALDFGAGLIQAGNMAMKQFAENIRAAKLRQMAAFEATKPADPLELAKLAGMMEGVNLDPTAGWKETTENLVHHDPDADADKAIEE